MAAIGNSIKQKLDEIKDSQWLKNKKVIYGLVVGSTAIAIAFTIGMTRNNSFQVIVNDEVVGVMETKEEVASIVDEVIQEKEAAAKGDIAINESIKVEPVHSKKEELMTKEDLSKVLEEVLSYEKRAVKITIDNKTEVIVATQEEADAILKSVAKEQLPEGAEVELGLTVIDDVALLEQKSVEDTSTTEPQSEGEIVETPEGEASKKDAEATPEVEVSKEDAEATPEVEASKEDATATPEVEASKEDATATPEGEVAKEDATATPEVEASKEDATATPEGEITEVVDDGTIVPQYGIKEDTNINQVNVAGVTVDGKDYELESTDNVKREMQVFDFYQQVVVEDVYVDEQTIIPQEDALNILLSNTDEVVFYEMEEGDNIWDLAIENGTTMDRILEINPEITDVNRMQIGEVIKLEAPDPVLAMVTTQQATFKELIPSEIEYVEFSDLYKDETKVYQEGHDGLKEITVLVHKVNGKEVSRDLLGEELIKEPKTKVIAFGTKPKPAPKPSQSTGSSSGSSSAGGSVSSSSGMFMHPLNGKGTISSHYGSRWGSFHRGIDIAAPAGTPIYASASGTVTYSGYNNGGFGYLVIIDHGNGYETYYAHNKALYVNVGQYVNKGQNIAGVGSTGNSTGNHIHFEIRKNGSPINPYGYIY